MSIKLPLPPLPFVALVAVILLPLMIVLGFQVRQLSRIEYNLGTLLNTVPAMPVPSVTIEEKVEVASPSPSPKSKARPMVASPRPDKE